LAQLNRLSADIRLSAGAWTCGRYLARGRFLEDLDDDDTELTYHVAVGDLDERVQESAWSSRFAF
jgi:hypothetical protein